MTSVELSPKIAPATTDEIRKSQEENPASPSKILPVQSILLDPTPLQVPLMIDILPVVDIPRIVDEDLKITVVKHDETLEEIEQRILKEKNKRQETISKLDAKVEKLKAQRQKQTEYIKSKRDEENRKIEQITKLIEVLKDNKENDLKEKDEYIEVLSLKGDMMSKQLDLIGENYNKRSEKLTLRISVIEELKEALSKCIDKPRKSDSFCHEIYSTARQQTLYIEQLTEAIAETNDGIKNKEAKILNLQNAMKTVIAELQSYEKTILCLNKCNYEIDETLDNIGEGDYTHRNIKSGNDLKDNSGY